MTHTHEATKTTEKPCTGDLLDRKWGENPRARGGRTYIETCGCGHLRVSHCNGRHEESTGWVSRAKAERFGWA